MSPFPLIALSPRFSLPSGLTLFPRHSGSFFSPRWRSPHGPDLGGRVSPQSIDKGEGGRGRESQGQPRDVSQVPRLLRPSELTFPTAGARRAAGIRGAPNDVRVKITGCETGAKVAPTWWRFREALSRQTAIRRRESCPCVRVATLLRRHGVACRILTLFLGFPIEI